VRVSLICFAKRAPTIRLNGRQVTTIHADLTSGDADLTKAVDMSENRGVAFNGVQKTGPFEIVGDTARRWLEMPNNPNGRPNSDVLKPYWNGIDVTRRLRDSWIVDFGPDMLEPDAALYAKPFGYILEKVKPIRAANKLEPLRVYWWRHWRPRAHMRVAIAKLDRAIVTPEVAKHRVFVWLPLSVGPDKNLIVIARDDDTSFGILQSRFHELWALRMGTWLGVGNDPRYTPSTTFDTFPFPSGLTPNVPAASFANNPHAQGIAAAARELVEKRDLWLNPPDLVERVPEVVPGFPDRIIPRNPKATAILKTRTLTNLYNMRDTPEGTWLDNLHRTLDEAVAAAYGWPADLSDDEILSRLLELNRARAAS
jgi:type II restriction/modification system DNA methylase subunit YeeA